MTLTIQSSIESPQWTRRSVYRLLARRLPDRPAVRVIVLRVVWRAVCAGADRVPTEDIARRSGNVPSILRVQGRLAPLRLGRA